MTDKSVRLQFERLFRERLAAQQWTASRMHDTSEYLWDAENVVETTLAEHAERRLRERLGFLLTFARSVFVQGRTVRVTREQQAVMLDAVIDATGLGDWYSRHPELVIVTYDLGSEEPPRDHQTLLGRRSRFSPRNFVNQGRKVYLDRETDRYWCVDNQHAGQSAHLEVFDAQGNHVGEARLDGAMLPDSRDATKTLYL